MNTHASRNSQLGLLYLSHLLIGADGSADLKEFQALSKIREKESIPDSIFKEFEAAVGGKNEREIYKAGMELINSCTDEEKLNAFSHLYKLSEIDGRVHVKEIRLLLYTIKNARIEFNDVVAQAKTLSDY
ncbi:MAG: hypothetical protein JNL53_20980 [Cyclobacteriaceae bacterium]|nr:hypothetical protein [Cyclobacteriaceae bacterium]